MYGVTATALKMTTTQWIAAMTGVITKMKNIAERASNRDLAWNLIMFASYSAKILGPITKDMKGKVYPGGTLEFYSAADADVLFGGIPIVSANFANADHGVCDPKYVTASFDAGKKSFIFELELCKIGYCDPYDPITDYKYSYINQCKNWYSGKVTRDGITSGYPSPPLTGAYPPLGTLHDLDTKIFSANKIFEASQFGYRYGKAKSNTMQLQVDSRSLSLALAVNYGMLLINDLVKIERDPKLTAILTNLAKQDQITIAQANSIFSFYDKKQLPMDPIYCMVFDNAAFPGADGLPSFNEGGDDDSILGGDDTFKNDDEFKINFGGSKKDINEIPADLAVSFSFVIKDYDFNNPTTPPTSHLPLLETAINNAWTNCNIPSSAAAHVSKVSDKKLWWLNDDPSTNTNSNSGQFLPYTRKLVTRKLAAATIGSTTSITYGFKWNPTLSGKKSLYEALEFLTQTIIDSDFFTKLNIELSTLKSNNPSDTFNANNPTSSKYNFFVNDFYVKPKTIVDDDYVKKNPSNDDYFADDGGSAVQSDDGNRRELSETDLKSELRNRIHEIGTKKQVENFRLLKSKPIPKVNKNTGATCFILAGETFMYPVASHYGQAGTTRCSCKKYYTPQSGTPKYVNEPDCYSVDKMTSPSDNVKNSTECPTIPDFPFLPKDCESSNSKDKNSCKFVNINVGLIFYPFKADPRNRSPKQKPRANGQILNFGLKAQSSFKQDPVNADIKFIKSSLNAMGMVSSATEDYNLLANGNLGDSASNCESGEVNGGGNNQDHYSTNCNGKRYMTKFSEDRWKKAFYELCGPTKCSMLYFRLTDSSKTPRYN